VRRGVGLRELGPWYGFAACVLKPLCWAFTRPDWRGTEHVPQRGGVILASNHISHADPIVLADYVVYGTGRIARFMAKSTLFTGSGLVAKVMRGAQQIPVHRATSDASLALSDAVAALHAGECVVIYPEGTVSREPDKWPMPGKTGVARLTLLSGAPVVPVAQWGAERIHDTYRTRGVHLLPRTRVVLEAGPAVDLSAYEGRALTAEVLRGATDAVLDAITDLLEPLRGERRPHELRGRSSVHPVRRTA